MYANFAFPDYLRIIIALFMYFERKIHSLIDIGLKASIFVEAEVDVSLTTGRTSLEKSIIDVLIS